MGGDSCSEGRGFEGRGFESRRRILDCHNKCSCNKLVFKLCQQKFYTLPQRGTIQYLPHQRTWAIHRSCHRHQSCTRLQSWLKIRSCLLLASSFLIRVCLTRLSANHSQPRLPTVQSLVETSKGIRISRHRETHFRIKTEINRCHMVSLTDLLLI